MMCLDNEILTIGVKQGWSMLFVASARFQSLYLALDMNRLQIRARFCKRILCRLSCVGNYLKKAKYYERE